MRAISPVQPSHLTIGEVADFFQVPAWRIRRVVDSLGVDIPRAGLYRLIPRDLLATVAAELQRKGCLPPAAEVAAR